ncbi:MAG: AAA family ATPase [Gemmatimonadaceae bacterium]|nr:AAA family ATPase [Gemmatimonadaceae bacterium]
MNNVIPLRATPIDGKVPAHDEATEAATLSACMNVPTIAAQAMSIAGPDDYYSGLHREIAKAIVAVLEAGQAPSPGAVMIRLRETGRMSIVGGERVIVDLMNDTPAVQSMIHRYAGKVRDLAQLRRLGTTLHGLLAECYGSQPDVPAFLARVDAAVGEVTRRLDGQAVVGVLEATKAVARALDAPKHRLVTTGFPSLDAMTQGFEPSALYILGARTGMGKTAMAMQFVAAAAEAGNRVLVVSMEMPKTQIVRRMICSRSGVALQHVKDRSMSPAAYSRFTLAASDIASMPIFIADKPGQTLLEIKSAVRAHKPDLVVVDHIGLLRPADGSQASKRSREQEVGEFSWGLKALALETTIPVLALCQVGRDVAKGARRPALSDLRESGSIEQNADGVWLIHRPGYYDAKASPEVKREAELLVAKQRDGETGLLALEWESMFAVFREAAAS